MQPKRKLSREKVDAANVSPLRRRTPQPSVASTIRTTDALGILVARTRKSQGLLQQDVIGIADVGNRFISELENGKPTLQIQKVLDVLDILGLEVVVRRKGAGNDDR